MSSLHRYPLRFIALVSLHCVGACSGWRTVPVPSPRPDAPALIGARARVRTVDRTILEIREAAVWRDSLVGWAGSVPAQRWAAVPLAQVDRVQRRGFSIGKSTLLVVGILGALTAMTASSYATMSW